MYRALIIDDEADARSVLRRLIELFCPEVSTIVDAKNSAEALTRARATAFDLAFIDIKLRRENGLVLANQLILHCPNLIFVTAHDRFAAEAYRTEAIDYLLKPVDPEQLQKAVARANLAALRNGPDKDRILLSTKTGIIVLPQEEIIRVEGDGNYCTFVCKGDREFMVSKNLAHYESLLNEQRFYRVHQTHLVHLGSVRKYLIDDGYFAVLYNGDSVPVARRRKEGFIAALKAFRG